MESANLQAKCGYKLVHQKKYVASGTNMLYKSAVFTNNGCDEEQQTVFCAQKYNSERNFM